MDFQQIPMQIPRQVEMSYLNAKQEIQSEDQSRCFINENNNVISYFQSSGAFLAIEMGH